MGKGSALNGPAHKHRPEIAHHGFDFGQFGHREKVKRGELRAASKGLNHEGAKSRSDRGRGVEEESRFAAEIPAEDSRDPGKASLPSQLTFPDANDSPPHAAQLPIHEPVPGVVALDLSRPVGRIVPGALVALGATMPEAAIHEDGQMLRWPDKIWLAKHRLMAAPAAETSPPERRRQPHLGAGVPGRPDGGHVSGAAGSSWLDRAPRCH
jgi:hypothetical protein